MPGLSTGEVVSTGVGTSCGAAMSLVEPSFVVWPPGLTEAQAQKPSTDANASARHRIDGSTPGAWSGPRIRAIGGGFRERRLRGLPGIERQHWRRRRGQRVKALDAERDQREVARMV